MIFVYLSQLQKPELECDVSLKSVTFAALGRFKDAQTFDEVSVTLPVKEGELEIEVSNLEVLPELLEIFRGTTSSPNE